jgi:DNA-binding response OmpR family regulator
VVKTLLAVDDSVTMRKVLEITFSGEDFRVVTADTTQAALARLGENPNVCVIDTVLGSEDGYALAKEVRRQRPAASILMLASRYAPYDQARGRDAGADDWADKPFDTQQLIDKVRKVLVAKEAGGGAVTAAPVPPAAPPAGARPAASPTSGAVGRPAANPAARTGTLVFGEGGLGNAPGGLPSRVGAPPPAPPPPAMAAPPPPAPPPAPVAPPPAAQAAVGAAVNGQLAGKLGDLGLSPQQADAVLALSREVVERIVWEVVPQLAEALIKEEIARLTKE